MRKIINLFNFFTLLISVMSEDSTNYGGYFFFIFLIIGWITDPDSLQKHKDAVRSYYNEKYLGISEGNSDLQNIQNGIDNFENTLRAFTIEPLVGYRNYYVFSLTTYADKVVGIGVFSKVFVFGDLTPKSTTEDSTSQK